MMGKKDICGDIILNCLSVNVFGLFSCLDFLRHVGKKKRKIYIIHQAVNKKDFVHESCLLRRVRYKRVVVDLVSKLLLSVTEPQVFLICFRLRAFE